MYWIRLCFVLSSIELVLDLQTEVDLLSKIQHPNIISLLGYSIHGDTRLIVYELMENGSLETQLHGKAYSLYFNVYKAFRFNLLSYLVRSNLVIFY